MHNILPLRVPGFRLPTMEHSLPGPYQPGSGEPLYPYVCHLDHEQRTKP